MNVNINLVYVGVWGVMIGLIGVYAYLNHLWKGKEQGKYKRLETITTIAFVLLAIIGVHCIASSMSRLVQYLFTSTQS